MTAAAVFLLQSVLIVGVPYFLWARRWVRPWLPLVAVQIVVGLALGPSLLGRLAPELQAALFPPASLPALEGLAQIAIVFFAFLVGLHFDLAELRGRGGRFAAAAFGSVAVPVLAGAVAGVWLFDAVPQAVGSNGRPLLFAVGMGIAAGVTALPVLGAILREMHLARDAVGSTALGLAAANDAALWVLIAALLVSSGGGDPLAISAVLSAVTAYVMAMSGLMPRLFARLFRHALRSGHLNERDVVVIATLLMISALVAEIIGIHYVVGAFAFGAVMPKAVARDVLAKFESVIAVVLLPFFFMTTGLGADVRLSGGEGVIFTLMTAVSVTGKLAGTVLPLALGTGRWREPLLIGAFMQCKGLMEIVVLTLLLDAGIISPACFSAMVLMALATTAATKPLAALLLPRKSA
jgi:Kef-type K+ transport system membrane component KefB